MNLSPAKNKEPVTILLVPFDQYSVFPKCIDALYEETSYPFKLIVIEGNAPDSIRHELEKRQKKHGNLKIIYSNHRPRMAEAFNLGLAHIRTQKVFLMHNHMKVTPGWLSNLMEFARHRSGILCPYISYAQERSRRSRKDLYEIDMHGLLLSKEILERLGEFDESVSATLLGVDLGQRLKTKEIPVERDPSAVLEYLAPAPFKGADLELFDRQWDPDHTRQAVAHLNRKWSISLAEDKYLEWLTKKRSISLKKPAFSLPPNLQKTPLWAEDPGLGLKRLLQTLRGA